MKKIVLLLTIVFTIVLTIVSFNNKKSIASSVIPSQTAETTMTASNTYIPNINENIYTPTFQLCWNEFIDLVNTNNTISYIGGNPPLADELNKQVFVKEDMDADSYYVKVGKMNLKLKKQIETDIKNKFNEKSDILESFEFPNVRDDKVDKWFIYSMLLKSFEFKNEFSVIEPQSFGKDKVSKYKYMGLFENPNDKDIQLENLSVMFYADDDDFSIKLFNKNNNEEMILYLTDSDKPFNDLYKEVLKKSKHQEEYTQNRINKLLPSGKTDNVKVVVEEFLKIPYLSIDENLNYDKELANKFIQGNGNNLWMINKTVQTIKFDLDNKGAKLKSEAAIEATRLGCLPITQRPVQVILENFYYFNRPFVLFMKEAGKEKPYFAIRITNGQYLVK